MASSFWGCLLVHYYKAPLSVVTLFSILYQVALYICFFFFLGDFNYLSLYYQVIENFCTKKFGISDFFGQVLFESRNILNRYLRRWMMLQFKFELFLYPFFFLRLNYFLDYYIRLHTLNLGSHAFKMYHQYVRPAYLYTQCISLIFCRCETYYLKLNCYPLEHKIEVDYSADVGVAPLDCGCDMGSPPDRGKSGGHRSWLLAKGDCSSSAGLLTIVS